MQFGRGEGRPLSVGVAARGASRFGAIRVMQSARFARHACVVAGHAPGRAGFGIVNGVEATRAIRRLAERQHGVVSRRQLIALGLSSRLIRHRRERGDLVPLHQGVFALGHERIGNCGLWIAAVLACGPGAALSHGSAAALWGLRAAHSEVEVLRRSGGGSHRDVRIHQTRCLEPDEVALEKRIPVTVVERTLIDIAGRSTNAQLERLLVAADRGGRLNWERLHRLLRRRKGRKGAGRLRRIAMEVDPEARETRSDGEVDFLALVRRAGLPTPAVNVLVAGHMVDFLWPRERVIVETDSWEYHGSRPHFEHDHRRDVDLVAAGYEVHRATHRMLARDPRPFLSNVRRALGRRSTESRPDPAARPDGAARPTRTASTLGPISART